MSTEQELREAAEYLCEELARADYRYIALREQVKRVIDYIEVWGDDVEVIRRKLQEALDGEATETERRVCGDSGL